MWSLASGPNRTLWGHSDRAGFTDLQTSDKHEVVMVMVVWDVGGFQEIYFQSQRSCIFSL